MIRSSEARALAESAARCAGAIQKQAFSKQRDIRYKGETDLVTDVDLACEAAIVETIRAAFPDHAILAEEGGAQAGSAAARWIIDPLDGTTNFAHGYPCFAASVACEVEGELLAGCVYNPLSDECFTAAKGEGATRNGEAIRVSHAKALIACLGVTGFSHHPGVDWAPDLRDFEKVLRGSRGLRRDGSAALDLCGVAMGRFDFFFERNLAPWDVAAGWLIVAEAGGHICGYSGQGLGLDSKEIVAGQAEIVAALVALLDL